MLSIIIPANNEVGYIEGCLASLLAQEGPGIEAIDVVVVANNCSDDTVSVAVAFADRFDARGWRFKVLDLEQGGKPFALNQGDAAASGAMRLYLDADITMDKEMLSQLIAVLSRDAPVYASGQMVVATAKSWVTRRFMDLWARVPFTTAAGVTGAGLFAVNAAGRARWGAFPDVIADDSFVRLQFAPEERIGVPASYLWLPVEGFAALVKVRRRQDAGSREIEEKYPDILANEGKPTMGASDHIRLFVTAPVSYMVYAAVKMAGKFGGGRGYGAWSRGR